MIYSIIDDFVDYIQQVLGYTPSVYLYGSVMSDDFTPNSDVDLLIVTPQPLTSEQSQRLLSARKFLAEVRESEDFNKLNGAIICKADLLGNTANQVLFYSKGKQNVDDVYPLNVIDVLALKTQSKLLVGDDVLANMPIPSRAQIFAECQKVVQMVSLCGKADGTTFAYECMFWLARALYTFVTNEIASKSDAMLWAMEQGHVDEKVAMQCLAYHVTDANNYSAKMKANLKSDAWQNQINKLLAVATAVSNAKDSFVPTVEVFYNGDEDEPKQTGKLTWKRR